MELLKDRAGRRGACQVTRTARDRLGRTAYPAIRNVLCEYANGVLVLRGRLPNFFHKQVAQEAVLGIPGVDRVENQTEVLL